MHPCTPIHKGGYGMGLGGSAWGSGALAHNMPALTDTATMPRTLAVEIDIANWRFT